MNNYILYVKSIKTLKENLYCDHGGYGFIDYEQSLLLTKSVVQIKQNYKKKIDVTNSSDGPHRKGGTAQRLMGLRKVNHTNFIETIQVENTWRTKEHDAVTFRKVHHLTTKSHRRKIQGTHIIFRHCCQGSRV